MSESRLELQYRRLLNLYPQRQVTLTLEDIAIKLCCSKRHIRTVLQRMQQAGWLEWQPGRGRGHHSRLLLHFSEQQLLLQQAQQLLEKGQHGKAISLAGDQQNLLIKLLGQRLGYRVTDDYSSLRVPYYRPMPVLYPCLPLRRSETHLLRQIFSGLTRVDPTTAQPESDLAHHWTALNERHWRFYLRPGVRFHDGSELVSEDVVASLRRAAEQPLFTHLHSVIASGRLSVDVHLSQPDPQLPLLLTHVAALILPGDHLSRKQFSSHPIGTGPYQVIDNSPLQLRLQAFNDYFGLRGLLDEVDIIVCPPLAETDSHPPQQMVSPDQDRLPAAWLSSSVSDMDHSDAAGLPVLSPKQDEEMFPEKGGYFLLCDQRSPSWQSASARCWLREVLSPQAILHRLPPQVQPLWIPANSLLPDWHHCMCHPVGNRPAGLSAPQACLRLVVHRQHPEFKMLTDIMQALLQQQGIQLQCIEADYPQWWTGEGEADLWLGTVNFPIPEEWNVGAWLTGMPLLRTSISGGDQQQLDDWQWGWRQGTLSGKSLTAEVLAEGWLQPLFHHWMRLKSPGQAQGIKLNNLGWFDFSQTWMPPGTAR